MDKYAKAIVGALTAGLTAAGTALADGAVTAPEWIGIAGAVVASLGLVWAVPNAPAAAVDEYEGEHERP